MMRYKVKKACLTILTSTLSLIIKHPLLLQRKRLLQRTCNSVYIKFVIATNMAYYKKYKRRNVLSRNAVFETRKPLNIEWLVTRGSSLEMLHTMCRRTTCCPWQRNAKWLVFLALVRKILFGRPPRLRSVDVQGQVPSGTKRVRFLTTRSA